jgi:hypothetical protein
MNPATASILKATKPVVVTRPTGVSDLAERTSPPLQTGLSRTAR